MFRSSVDVQGTLDSKVFVSSNPGCEMAIIERIYFSE